MKARISYQLAPMSTRPYGALATIETSRASIHFLADSDKSYLDAKEKVLERIRKIYLPVPEPEEIEIEL